MPAPRFRSQQLHIYFQIQKGRARLQSGSRLRRRMGRREKAQTGPRLQRPPKLRGLQPVSLPPFSVQEVDLDWGVSGQSQPRTLGDPEGESVSRSLHPGLSRPAMLKFPIDWRSRCYSGTRRQKRRAGNGEDRACSPPRTGGGGTTAIPPPRNAVHTSPFLASLCTHFDCESHYRRRARDFLNIYSPLSAR